MNHHPVPAVALAGAVLALFGSPTLGADELMPGTIGVVRPLGAARFTSRAPSGMPFDPPALADDPTVAGGALRIFDTGGAGGDHTYSLPAANWDSLGQPGEFRYQRELISDPVRRVILRGNVVRAIVQRQGPNWTPPFDDEMAVVLTIGATSRYCASFGGTTIANSPQRLRRRLAPPPGACASPSGAFLEATGTLFD
jgi:hypothetical protein